MGKKNKAKQKAPEAVKPSSSKAVKSKVYANGSDYENHAKFSKFKGEK